MSAQRAFGLTLLACASAALLEGQAFASPLRFELNAGQHDAAVRFAARGNGFGLYVTDRGATLSLRKGPKAPQVSVTMRVVGARQAASVGVGELSERSNYFVGSDPSSWQQNVANYGAVRQLQVLPGVSVLYHASQAQELEYDLELDAGTDPRNVRVELEGIRSLALDAHGDALLTLSDGSVLRKRSPIAYQIDAKGRRELVAARFVKRSATQLGFAIGSYDAARPLIIDPTLTYASYLGGSKFDEFFAVAADSAGNTYAAGYTTGTLFPTRSPAQAAFGGGNSDAVICKVRADGTTFVYSTYLGGSETDRAYGIAVDPGGAAYVTGVTLSANYPTLGALQSAKGGGQDAFVAKLSSTGTLSYSTFLGGSGDDLAQAIAVRATGEAYVAGTTFSANFPSVLPAQATLNGTSDAFVARLNAAGNALTTATFLGGSQAELAQAIAVDISGNVVVAGQTASNNFPTLAAAQATFGGGQSDAFVTRYGPSGNAIGASTYIGGSSTDVATGVAISGGTPVVSGYTQSFDFPLANPTQSTFGGGADAFVTRVSGSFFDFSTYLGGSGIDTAAALVADQNGFVYVTGQTASSNFPSQFPLDGLPTTLQGGSDAFLGAFSPSGTRMYSTFLGGNAADSGVGVALGGATTLHLLGNTFSNNLPVVGVPVFQTAPGPQDGFIVRLGTLSLSPAPSTTPFTALLGAALLLGVGLVFASRLVRERG